MSEWREVRLGDLCEHVTVGHVGKMADQYVDDGVPFLRSQDVRPFELAVKGAKRVSRSFHERLRKSALRPGDVVVVRTGYPGTAAVVPAEIDEANCADLVIIRPSPALDGRLVAGYFNSAFGKGAVGGRLVGSAQQHFNVRVAADLRLSLPDRRTQSRIGDVLDSLIELIENNRRRIEILEEAVRSLYREWFVHFRFPGHEATTFVDSPLGTIPEGWEIERLGDLLDLRYGKALKAADRQGGPVAVVGSSGVVGRHHEAMADGPGIVVGRKGHVGSVIWLNGPFFPIDTTYFVASDYPMRWLRYLLESLTFENSHAAVPGLSRDAALRADVLQPPLGHPRRFDAEARPLLDLVETLQATISQTDAARDELLPKLVTGAIEVDSLGLDDVFGWAELAAEAG